MFEHFYRVLIQVDRRSITSCQLVIGPLVTVNLSFEGFHVFCDIRWIVFLGVWKICPETK